MRCDSLKELANVSKDVTFAQEFISRDGHLLLVKIVEDAKELVLHVCVCVHGWGRMVFLLRWISVVLGGEVALTLVAAYLAELDTYTLYRPIGLYLLCSFYDHMKH